MVLIKVIGIIVSYRNIKSINDSNVSEVKKMIPDLLAWVSISVMMFA